MQIGPSPVLCLRFVAFNKNNQNDKIKTDARIVSDETCRYNTTYDPSDLRDYEFCAGKMEGGSSRCVGSGLKIKSLLTRRG